MTDYFALLGEPRRPWIEPDPLKARFLAIAAAAHPDRQRSHPDPTDPARGVDFATLNTAFNCLRETKDRLHHLLELELGRKPDRVEQVGNHWIELFGSVNLHSRQADEHLRTVAGATSPLLKAQRVQRGFEFIEALTSLDLELNARREQLDQETRSLNAAWETAPPVDSPSRAELLPCRRLEELWRDYGYVTRWSRQIRERIFLLTP